MIDWVLAHDRCALWAGMGSGKTSAMLYVISVWKMLSVGPTLVVAPKRVAGETWPEQQKIFDEFDDIRLVTLTGIAAEREAALQRDADIYCVNPENLRWLAENLPTGFKFEAVIVDESTRLKSFRLRKGSKRAKILFTMTRSAVKFVELTGTPGGNGLIDLWGQLYFLDYGARLGKTFQAFTGRWFTSINCGYFNKVIPQPSAFVEIPERVADICRTIRTEDYFSIEKTIENTITVKLPSRVLSLYKTLEREMYVQIETSGVRAVNAAVVTVKCLQICSGALYQEHGDGDGEPRPWFELHQEKIDALESIIEEASGEPILVAYHFRSDVVRIMARFKNAVHFTNKTGILDAWNAGDIPILLAHPGSVGHGLNMQRGGRIIVFFSLWWNLEEHEQIIARIGPLRQHQAGLDRSVYVYNIVAENTIDERVLLAHQNKMSANEALKMATGGSSRDADTDADIS